MIQNPYQSAYGSFVGSEKGYCGMRNRLRIQKFTALIQPKQKDVILEIGCNAGLLVKHLSLYTSHWYGIDVNSEMVRRLKTKRIRCMSATDLKFPRNFFTKVCAFEVIEHIPNIKKVFLEIYRVLKPQGKCILSFPVEIIRGQSALLDACIVYKNPWYARKLHVHKLSPSRIKKIIHGIPFTIIRKEIMWIPFPSYVMVLEKRYTEKKKYNPFRRNADASSNQENRCI